MGCSLQYLSTVAIAQSLLAQERNMRGNIVIGYTVAIFGLESGDTGSKRNTII